MTNQVGSLRLHVRTHGEPAPDVQARSRRFAEHLLDAIARKLEDRAGGRLVLIRRLPVRLRASIAMLADASEIERMADAIAASIDIQPSAAPPEEADVVVFDSDAHWRAAYLVNVANNGPTRWYYATLANADDRCASITTMSTREIETILQQVDRENALRSLLDSLDVDLLVRLATSLDVLPPMMANEASATARPTDGGTALLRTTLAARITSKASLAVVDRAAQNQRTAVSAMPDETTQTSPSVCHVTRHAGLVYLVRCLLELDAGAVLWRACVAEQMLITAALASLIDDVDDPAPFLLGGAAGPLAFEVSRTQRDEIVTALCTELFASLPRRGLAVIPDVQLTFVGDAHRRVFCALVDSRPIFAAPAPVKADAVNAIEQFLGIWTSGSVHAPRAICELVPQSRIQRSNDAATASLHLETTDGDLVVAVVAGTATCLLQSRGGDCNFAIRGRIEDSADRRIVTMPMDAIRLSIRRAGLDSDPGWVPWLSRSIRIVFDE